MCLFPWLGQGGRDTGAEGSGPTPCSVQGPPPIHPSRAPREGATCAGRHINHKFLPEDSGVRATVPDAVARASAWGRLQDGLDIRGPGVLVSRFPQPRTCSIKSQFLRTELMNFLPLPRPAYPGRPQVSPGRCADALDLGVQYPAPHFSRTQTPMYPFPHPRGPGVRLS